MFLRQAGDPGGWFSNRSVSGGGPLIDLGVHFLDMALWLMDFPEPVAVTGYAFHRLGSRGNIRGLTRYLSADQTPSDDPVEDLAGALVRFADGAVLSIETSYSLHGRDSQSFEVFGERGGATLEPELRITTELHDTVVEIAPNIDALSFDLDEGFQVEIDTFVRTVRGEIPSVAPAAHGCTSPGSSRPSTRRPRAGARFGWTATRPGSAPRTRTRRSPTPPPDLRGSRRLQQLPSATSFRDSTRYPSFSKNTVMRSSSALITVPGPTPRG
ncbi:Gfo/Idh/MocA family protein [Clavibacter tessellarius]|uniref:Gfo/Idh/MocA family protein n=1 Tax=Clavibacter tessellarius TaxID=31965 RepID=UPI0039BF8C7C